MKFSLVIVTALPATRVSKLKERKGKERSRKVAGRSGRKGWIDNFGLTEITLS